MVATPDLVANPVPVPAPHRLRADQPQGIETAKELQAARCNKALGAT